MMWRKRYVACRSRTTTITSRRLASLIETAVPRTISRSLPKEYVFALDVYSVEAMYYCSHAIEAVARRQAESMGRNADEMIQSAKKKALGLLKQGDLAESMAARRCEGRVRNWILSQAPNWKSIRDNADLEISCPVNSLYTEELDRFKELAREGDLDGLVARYPLRESNVFGEIAKALECKKKNYEKMVVSRIRKDGALAQKLRERVALPLYRIERPDLLCRKMMHLSGTSGDASDRHHGRSPASPR